MDHLVFMRETSVAPMTSQSIAAVPALAFALILDRNSSFRN